MNLELSACASVASANNMNKLLLVGMQLPEKYMENFHVLREGQMKALPGKLVQD
jgi:hypothetical protein